MSGRGHSHHPLDQLPLPLPPALAAAAANPNAAAAAAPVVPVIPAAGGGVPLPVLVAPPMPSMLAGRPRYLPPTLGERKALSMGAASLLGAGSSGTATGGSGTPTLHSWFGGMHPGSGSTSRSERSSSRNSAGIPPQLKDLFNAAPGILVRTSHAVASRASEPQSDLLEWDPFAFGELVRRSHSRASGDDDDYAPVRTSSSTIASTEVQTTQAIERGNQLLDIIYQLCDYIIANQRDSTSATTRSVSGMLLKFIDALMAMDQTTVAATVAAHQAAATASAAARATGSSQGSSDDHFIAPISPFWLWTQSLSVVSTARPSVTFGASTVTTTTTDNKSSDSKTAETKTNDDSKSENISITSPIKPSSSSTTSSMGDEGDDASTSVAGGRKRRRAASAATTTMSRSSSTPHSSGSSKSKSKKSKVSTTAASSSSTSSDDTKDESSSSTTVAASSSSSSSSSAAAAAAAVPEAATELERFTIRMLRTCLALSSEYGGRRTLRHMLELLRLLVGGTSQSHRQRLLKLPVPATPNLVASGLMAVKEEVVDKLLDRLLFDVDERAPSATSSADAQLKGLSAQGPTKRTRTGSGGSSSSAAAGGSPGANGKDGDAATAATTCSLRYFLALLLHPPVVPTTTTAVTRSSSNASAPSASAAKATTSANDAAPSTDALSQLRTYLMDLFIGRLVTVFSRPRTNGYIAGYMVVLLPLVVHARQFKPFISAVTTALKRDDLPMNSLACLLDALNQLFALLRAVQSDSASTSTSVRKTAVTAPGSPVVKAEPSESATLDIEITQDGLCTWLVTGNDFATQPAYSCFTCNLTGRTGCCGACVRTCHAGHDVAYAGRNYMYCDCGSAPQSRGEHPLCQALKKPTPVDDVYTTNDTITSLVVSPAAAVSSSSASSSSSDSKASDSKEVKSDTKVAETKTKESKRSSDDDSMDQRSDEAPSSTSTSPSPSPSSSVAPSAASLEPHPILTTIIHVIDTVTKRIAAMTASESNAILPTAALDESQGGSVAWLPPNVTIPRMTAMTSIAAGSFNFQPPPPPPQGRHGRGQSSSSSSSASGSDSKNGNGPLQHAAWLSPSLLLIAEAQQVSVFDTTGSLYKRERAPSKVTIARSDMALISAVSIPFPVCGLVVNPACKEHVAVFGKKQLRVLIFDPKGRSAQRVTVELALDSVQTSSSQPLSVLKVDWVPNSQVLLAVTTSKFVKVFDLSKDTISPTFYFNPTRSATLKDSTLVMNHYDHTVTLFVLATDGRVLIHKVNENFPGPHDLATVLTLSSPATPGSGSSIHWSATLNRLLVSWASQPCYVITMDEKMAKATSSVPLRYAEPFPASAATMTAAMGTGMRLPLRDISSTVNFSSWIDVATSLPYPGVVGTVAAITKDASSNITRVAVIHQLASGLTYARMSRISATNDKKVVALLDCSPTSEVISPTALVAASAALSTSSAASASTATATTAGPASSPTSASNASSDDTIESTIPSASAPAAAASSTSASSALAGMVPSVMILQDNGSLLHFAVAPVEDQASDHFSAFFPPFIHDVLASSRSTSSSSSSASAVTAVPRPSRSAQDSTIFERAKVVTSMLLNGDFSESSETARRALAMDQGESLRSQRAGRLSINIDLPPSSRRDEYIVGVRVLVGRHSVASIPASLRIDQLGRARSFPRDQARWHDMPFSYDESTSLLHNESNTLHLYFTAVPSAAPAVAPVAPAAGSSGAAPSAQAAGAPAVEEHPRIDCLEVYTIPRRVLDVAFGATPPPASPATQRALGTPGATPNTVGRTATSAACEAALPELSTIVASSETVPRDKITQAVYTLAQTVWQSLDADSNSNGRNTINSSSGTSGGSNGSLASAFKIEIMRSIKPGLSVSPTAGAHLRLVDVLKRPPTLRYLGLPEDLFRLVLSLISSRSSSTTVAPPRIALSQVALLRDTCLVAHVRDVLSDAVASCDGNTTKLRAILQLDHIQRALGDLSLIIGNRGGNFRAIVRRYHVSQPSHGIDDSRSWSNIFVVLLRAIVTDDVAAVHQLPLVQCLLRIGWECLRALAHDNHDTSDSSSGSDAAAFKTSSSVADALQKESQKMIDLLRHLLFDASVPSPTRTAAAIQFIAAFQLVGGSMDSLTDDSSSSSSKTPSIPDDINSLRNARDGKMIKYRCDHCAQFPITTVRWRCLDRHCVEYDLCDDCHRYIRQPNNDSTHRYNHPMERLPIEQAPLSEDKKEKIYDRILCPPGMDPDDTDTLMKMAVDISMGREPATPPSIATTSHLNPSALSLADYMTVGGHDTAERTLIRTIALDLARTFVAHQHTPAVAAAASAASAEGKLKESKEREIKEVSSSSSSSSTSVVVTTAARTRMLEATDRLPVMRVLFALIHQGELSGDDCVTVMDAVARELFMCGHANVAAINDSKSSKAASASDNQLLPASTQLLSILFLGAVTTQSLLTDDSLTDRPSSSSKSAADDDADESSSSASNGKSKKKTKKKASSKSAGGKAPKKAKKGSKPRKQLATSAAAAAAAAVPQSASSREDALEKILARAAARAASQMTGSGGNESVGGADMFRGDDEELDDSDDELMATLAAATGLHPSQLMDAMDDEDDDDDDDDFDETEDDIEERAHRRSQAIARASARAAALAAARGAAAPHDDGNDSDASNSGRNAAAASVDEEERLQMLENRIIQYGLASGPAARVIAKQVSSAGRHLPSSLRRAPRRQMTTRRPSPPAAPAAAAAAASGSGAARAEAAAALAAASDMTDDEKAMAAAIAASLGDAAMMDTSSAEKPSSASDDAKTAVAAKPSEPIEPASPPLDRVTRMTLHLLATYPTLPAYLLHVAHTCSHALMQQYVTSPGAFFSAMDPSLSGSSTLLSVRAPGLEMITSALFPIDFVRQHGASAQSMWLGAPARALFLERVLAIGIICRRTEPLLAGYIASTQRAAATTAATAPVAATALQSLRVAIPLNVPPPIVEKQSPIPALSPLPPKEMDESPSATSGSGMDMSSDDAPPSSSSMFQASTPTTTLRLMSMPESETQRGRWLTKGQLPSPLATSDASSSAAAVPPPVQIPSDGKESKKKAPGAVSVFTKDWENVLCRIIYSFRITPSDDAPRHLAKEFLATLCGSDYGRYRIYDQYVYQQELGRLYKLTSAPSPPATSATGSPLPLPPVTAAAAAVPAESKIASGIPEARVQRMSLLQTLLPYASRLKLHASFKRIETSVRKRPKNWIKYIKSRPRDLSFLVLFSLHANGADVIPAMLALLGAMAEDCVVTANPVVDHAHATTSKTKGSAAAAASGAAPAKGSSSKASKTESRQRTKHSNKLSVTELISRRVLPHFIQLHLLESSSQAVRKHAQSFLFFLWRCASPSDQHVMMTLVSEWIPFLPSYGRHAKEFIDFIVLILAESGHTHSNSGSSDASPSSGSHGHSSGAAVTVNQCSLLLRRFFHTIRTQNQLLRTHIDGELYHKLATLYELPDDQYYLSTDACGVCHATEVDFKPFKLKELEVESKYSHSTRTVKLAGAQSIQQIILRISEINPVKMLRTLKVYYNTENVADLTTFKDKWERWIMAKSLQLAPGQKDIKITLPIPIIAVNLLFQYSDCYDSADGTETLKCPRCNTFVATNKHGICPSCRENVYQCRQCRHINYEKLEGFLCPECGYSRFGTFTYHLLAKPSYVVSPVTNETERKGAMHTISVQNEQLEAASDSLEMAKRQMLHQFDELERKRPPSSATVSSAAAPTVTGDAKSAAGRASAAQQAQQAAHQAQAAAQAVQQAAANGGVPVDPPSTIRPLTVRRSTPVETMYTKSCKSFFDDIAHSYQLIHSARKELARYIGRPRFIDPVKDQVHGTHCYACGRAFLITAFSALSEVDKQCLSNTSNWHDESPDMKVGSGDGDESLSAMDDDHTQTHHIDQVTASIPSSLPVRWSGSPPEMASEFALLEDVLTSSMNPDVAIRVAARALLCMIITSSGSALAAVSQQLRARMHTAIANPTPSGVATTKTLTHSMRIVMALFELDPTSMSYAAHSSHTGGGAAGGGGNATTVLATAPLAPLLWETRMKLLMDIFYFAVEYGLKRFDVAEEVLLPSVELIMNMLKTPIPRDTGRPSSSSVPPLRITRSTSISESHGGGVTASVSLPSGSPKLVSSSGGGAPAKKLATAAAAVPHKSPSLRAAKSPSLSAAPSPARSSLVKRGSAPRKSPLSTAKKAPPRSSPPPLSIASSAAISSEQPQLSRRAIWLAECERVITDLGLNREASRGRLQLSIDYNTQWKHDTPNGKRSFDEWLAARAVAAEAIALSPEARNNQLAMRTIRKWRHKIAIKKGSVATPAFSVSFADNSWLARLLLCGVTPSLRSETAKLVRVLCGRAMDLPVNRLAIAKHRAEAEVQRLQRKLSGLEKKEKVLEAKLNDNASSPPSSSSSSSPPLLGRSESEGGSGRSLERKPSTDSTRAGSDDDDNEHKDDAALAAALMDESLDDVKLPPSPKQKGESKEKEVKSKAKSAEDEDTDEDEDKATPAAYRTPSIVFMFLELFVKMLRRMDTRTSIHSEQFFSLFHYLLNNTEATLRREFVVIKGIVPVLVRRINEEVAVIDRMENTFSVGNATTSATALSGLASLLSDLVATPSLRPVLRREGVPQTALNAFLKIRGLVLQRSRATDECSQILQQVVKSVFSDSDDDKRKIFIAYIGALDHSASDKRTIIFILEQICQLIKPERPERHCLLHLKKAPTQEDLIPGTMKKNPYSSKDFEGPLMLHVKNKILRDLGIDGGPPVDLLVNNRIINFDLPIIKVYDKVWRSPTNEANAHMMQILAEREHDRRASAGDEYSDSSDDDDMPSRVPESPMIVTYRLTGLDGEATEDKVDTLPDDAPTETDPEKEFAVSSEVLNCNGLTALLSRLAAITDFSSDLEYRLAEMLIKTLGYCCKLQSNRRHLLALDAPSTGGSATSGAAAATATAAGRFARSRSSIGGGAAFLSSLPAPLALGRTTSASSSSGAAVPPSPTAASPSPRGAWTARDVSSYCLLSLVKQLTRVLATKSAIELGVQLLALIGALSSQSEADRLEQAKADRVRRGISGDPLALEGKETKDSAGEPKSTLTASRSMIERASVADVDLSIAAKQLNGLLACLTAPFIRSQSAIVEEVMHVVPSLTFGQPGVTKVLLDIYQPHLNLVKYDSTGHRDADWTFHLTCLCHFAAGLNTSPVSQGVRTFLYEHRVIQQLMDHFKLMYNTRRPTDSKSRATGERVAIENSDMVDKPSLPFVLRLLTGFVRHHRPSQQLGVTTGLIEILHQIEDITSSKKVGPLAESLLEAMMVDNDEVQASVAALRRDKKDEKKKLAMAKREQMLKQMGFARSSAVPTMLVAERKIAGIEQLADSSGLTCMVCQEGEDYKPKQIMGVYVFCKEVVLESTEEEVGVTTVTHFNVVHFTCHKDAAKADKKLKPPKSEWEGATIRNSHTLCNNLFPIWSPTVPDTLYASKVQEYWSSMTFRSSLQLTRYELVVEDLRMLLARFAYEENFAEDSHGGGRESNMKFVPFLVQMAAHLYKTAITPVDQQRLVSGIMTQLSPSDDLPASVLAMLESEQLLTSVTHVLLLLSKDQWATMRLVVLKRLIGQVARDHMRDEGVDSKEAESKDAAASGTSTYWPQVRPILLFWTLVDSLMNVFVKTRSYETPSSAASSSAAAAPSASSSSSVASVSLLAGGKRKLDQIEEAAGGTAASAAAPSSSSSSSGMTRSQSLLSSVAAAEACTDQRSHVTHKHDTDIIKELDTLLRTFVDEVLPCTGEQELFDVIGVLSAITADGTTTAITYVTQHFDAARAAAIASS